MKQHCKYNATSYKNGIEIVVGNSQERMHGLEEGAELGKLRGDERKF